MYSVMMFVQMASVASGAPAALVEVAVAAEIVTAMAKAMTPAPVRLIGADVVDVNGIACSFGWCDRHAI
jgi:hypothetical protein